MHTTFTASPTKSTFAILSKILTRSHSPETVKVPSCSNSPKLEQLIESVFPPSETVKELQNKVFYEFT